MKPLLRHRGWAATGLLALLLVQGCASRPQVQADPRDPWEGMNRQIYAFNEKVDDAVLQPVARTYVKVLPSFVRTGVRNFMGNLGDVWTTVNAGLQLKGQAAAESFMRVAVNSTLGLYGVLDVATEAGLEKRREDFGQTLGHWGVGSGPYVMLPLFGPSTLRDTVALPLDMQAGPSAFFSGSDARNVVGVTRVIDLRAGLLQTSDALKGASLDSYSFVRDAWLQKRQSDVYDGQPPRDFDYSEP